MNYAEKKKYLQAILYTENGCSETVDAAWLREELEKAWKALENIKTGSFLDSETFEAERQRNGLVHLIDDIHVTAKEALDE